MKNLFAGRAIGLVYVLALILSFQSAQAMSNGRGEMIERASGMMEVIDKLAVDKKQDQAVDYYFTLLKEIAGNTGDVANKPLLWYADLLETSPEKALNAREFMKARRAYRKANKATMPKSGTFDSLVHQWADTLGQILVKTYALAQESDMTKKLKLEDQIDALKKFYKSLLHQLKTYAIVVDLK